MIDILGFLGEQAIDPPHVHIIDVGAMMIGANPWDALVQRGAATVIGFEPQAEECVRLEENAGPHHRYLPYALGDGGRWRFHRCNAPMTSSMYEPNLGLASRFQQLAEFMQVVEVSEIPTTRLDDVPEARGADLVKLDAQGFEHTILEHASAVLEAALIVQTEVCFVPLYKEQPLFAEVDRLLRSRGFMLHTMLGIGTRTFKPLVVGGDLHAGLDQYLWSDAVAKAHKVASDSFSGTLQDPRGLADTIEINGRQITVETTDDLLDLRDRINAANRGDQASGVTASVVSLSDDDHVLILSADETGTDAAMTFADTSGSVLQSLGVIDAGGAIRNELQAAANARFKVDGLAATIERQGNTVDDLFAGVTLTLFKAETGTTITLEVERDLNQVKQAIVDFVDAYNEVRTFINGQALTDVPEDDETGAGILAGTSVLSEARSRLSGAIGAAVDGTDPTFAVLAQIGITIQSPGKVADPLQASTLVIDETRLDETLLNEPDAVRKLFAFEMSSSSADVVLVGFDRNVRYSATGYQLNVAMTGGVVTSANLGGAADGSGDGTIEVKGNVLAVVDGPAKGLKLLYNGPGPASGVQLDLSVGVGAKMFHVVDAMVDDVDGLFAGEIASLQEQNARAETRVERLDELLERERERLIERFAAMEAALTSMNRLLDSLRDQIDAAFGERR